ncbi:MAG: DUF2330 domain-containing protein [Myxococcota bacterium]
MIGLVAAAHAFCGTFVGAPGDTLVNRASQVVLARNGDTTTLTVTADYTGDAAEFGLLLPVPEVLTAEDVRTMDPTLIERVATFSMPRNVAYTCDDLGEEWHDEGGVGCADYGLAVEESGAVPSAGDDFESTVDVESQFEIDGYEIVVLSAEESAGLTAWLDANGYAVPEGGDDVLQEYIDGGSYFLAARVSVDLTEPTSQLLPLQFTYDSDVFGLPIRIGTISADGEQEVLVFTLAPSVVGVANYPEVTVEDECMWKDDGDGFAAYWDRQLDDAFDGEAGWVSEYEWSLTAGCDPCTSVDGLTPEELDALGLDGYHGYLTRLRLRYTPEQATQDVVLYETGGGDTGWYASTGEQIRFIDYAEELERVFPVCGEGWVESPGACPPGPAVVGCGVPLRGVGVAGVLAALALARRRR